MPQYKFYRPQEQIKEVIKASYDPLKEWHQDPKSYFLIRVNPKKKQIEVGFVTPKDHVIRKMINGKYASEIYHTLLRRKLLTRMEHAAYLGKELFKAEMALKYGVKYRQDFLLELPMKVKVEMKGQS